MAECRSCGAPIMWVETEARADKPGRKMPLDAGDDGRALGVEGGNLVVVGRSDNDVPIVRYVKADGSRKLVSHFATCPNSRSHRKP